jgi:hypothetical protein
MMPLLAQEAAKLQTKFRHAVTLTYIPGPTVHDPSEVASDEQDKGRRSYKPYLRKGN